MIQIKQESNLQINDMKKYSSFKSIKPLNSINNHVTKQPKSPAHSSSYRKLELIDFQNQRSPQRFQIYPMSAKYSNYANMTSTNASKQKIFPSKNHETTLRLLPIKKQNYEEPTQNTGYTNIRSKINDLQSRLVEIRKNYDTSYNVRKLSQKDKSVKNLSCKQLRGPNKLISNIQNKQNQIPKEKKTQSKLLLQRYQTNKKKKNISSVSTINIKTSQIGQIRHQTDLSEHPLSPKNVFKMNNVLSSKKTEFLTFNSAVIDKILPLLTEQQKKEEYMIKNRLETNHGQQNSSCLKQFVTTFPNETKMGLSHSISEKSLYKPHNNLSLKKGQSEYKYYVRAILNAFQSKSLTSFENICRNHLSTSLEILSYIKNSKKQPPVNYTARRLPPVRDNRLTIVFDLDETLIHCNQNLTIDHDVALPIKFPNGTVLKAGINIRPYAQECLRQLSKYFQLIVFTASHQCYGSVIVDHLDPNKEFISYRYFRDSCLKTEQGFYVKDLRIIDRDLSKVLLIDNAAYSYCFQLQNGVPIVPFYDNKVDLQLKSLVPYLKGFLGLKDVRSRNQETMKLGQYTKFKDVQALICNLYALNQ